jgi:hypothetical protein
LLALWQKRNKGLQLDTTNATGIAVQLRKIAGEAADRINQLEAILSEIGFRPNFGDEKEMLRQYDDVRKVAREALTASPEPPPGGKG